MVELQVNVPTTCPAWLFSIYAANTVLLIATNIFALMVSTCLLPRMSAVSEEYNVSNLKSVPTFSPHDRLQGLISLSAGLAHVFGLFLFLFELMLLSWVKFWDFSIPAAAAGSLTMVPFIILIVFVLLHLKKVLAEHTCGSRFSQIKEVQTTFKNFI
jgi:calcium release-activated calcium channel protein 1